MKRWEKTKKNQQSGPERLDLRKGSEGFYRL